MDVEASKAFSDTAKLVTTSLKKKFLVFGRLFIDSVHRSGSLPETMITILIILYLIMMSFSSILPLSLDLWPPGEPLGNILYFISFIYRLDTNRMTDQGFRLHSVLAYGLIWFFFIIVFIFSIIFSKRMYLNPHLAKISMVWIDFLMPYALNALMTPMATIVYYVFADKAAREDFVVYIHFIILVLTYCLVFYILSTFILNEVSYVKGRSFTWTLSGSSFITFLISSQVFVTRLIEMSHGIPRIVFGVISAATSLIVGYTVYKRQIFIRRFYNILFSVLTCAGGILMIVNLSRFLGLRVESIIPLFVIAVLCVLFLQLMLVVDKKRIMSELELLDDSMNDPEYFLSRFKNPAQCMSVLKTGFSHGHPAVLDFSLITAAINQWPKNYQLLQLCIRFAAVYSSQEHNLVLLIRKFKSQFKEGSDNKVFRKRVYGIISLRSINFTPDIKMGLLNVDKIQIRLKRILSSYWGAIEKQQINQAYAKAMAASDLAKELDTRYKDLRMTYPNTPMVLAHHAEYLRETLKHPKEALEISLKSSALSAGKLALHDPIQDHALELFPLLPSPEREYFDLATTEEKQLSEEEKAASAIYEYASTVSVKSTSMMTGALIGIFLFSSILCLILPVVTTIQYYSEASIVYKGFITLNDYDRSVALSSYYYLAGYNTLHGDYPSPSEMSSLLGGPSTVDDDFIFQTMNLTGYHLDYAAKLLLAYGPVIEADSKTGTYFRTSKIPIYHPNSDGTFVIIESNFIGAVNTLAQLSRVVTTSDPVTMDLENIKAYIYSSKNVADAVQNASHLMVESLDDLLNSCDNDLLTIIIITQFVSIIFLLLSLWTIYNFQKDWRHFAQTTSTIPSVVLKKLSINNDESKKVTTRVEAEALARLESISDPNATSTNRLYWMFSFFALLSLIFSMALYFVVSSESNNIRQIAVIGMTNSQMIRGTFWMLNSLTLSATETDGYLFPGYTSQDILEMLRDDYKSNAMFTRQFYSHELLGVDGGMLSRTTDTIRDYVAYDNMSIATASTYYEAQANLSEAMLFELALCRLYIATTKALSEPPIFSGVRDNNVLQATHYIAYYLRYGMFYTIRVVDQAAMNSSVSDITAAAIYVLLLAVVISSILLIPTFIMIVAAIRTIKFSMTCLSMADPMSILRNADIMNYLSGLRKSTQNSTSALTTYFTEAANMTNEYIVVLDANLYILFSNNRVKEALGDIQNMHLLTLLQFENKDVMNSLERSLDGKTEDDTIGCFESVIKNVSTGDSRLMRVRLYVTFEENSRRRGVVIMEDITKNATTTNADHQSLTSRSYLPECLSGALDRDKGIYQLEVTLACITSICLRKWNPETRSALLTKIDSLMHETVDCIAIKGFSDTILIISNCLGNTTNEAKLVQDTFVMLDSIMTAAQANEIEISASIALSNNCVLEILPEGKDELIVHSSAIRLVHRASRHSPSSHVVFGSPIRDLLSEEDLKQTAEHSDESPIFKGKTLYKLPIRRQICII